MKREGRQHGMVRTFPILPPPFGRRPDPRSLYRLDSPPTAGIFTRVPPKPTNHSKFTGKCDRPRCAGCHIHPVSKAKAKAKGTQKLRSSDEVSNHRLVSWRVVDSNFGLKFSGFSASGILDHLDYMGYDDCVDEVYEESCDLVEEHDSVGHEIASEAVEIKGSDKENEVVDDDGENEEMGFYDVALVWGRVDEDEGWCLVAEM